MEDETKFENFGGPVVQHKTGFLQFLKQPRVFVKFVCVLLSVITLGCASSGCSLNKSFIFHNDGSACQYAVAISLLAFAFGILSTVSDFMYEKMSNVKRRRLTLLIDIVGSGLFAFLNFVGFCYLANRWSHTTAEWLNTYHFQPWQQRNARSVIFFSFVSCVSWAVLTFLALVRFRDIGQGLLSATMTQPGMMDVDPQAEAAGYHDSSTNDVDYPGSQFPIGNSGSQYPTNHSAAVPMGGGGGVGNVNQYYPPAF